MQITRNEIRTGLLVIITGGILMVILLAIGAPGVFKPLKTFRIFFNNAAGIKPGAPVQLAGRKVGQVIRIYSPIPETERPEGYPGYEVVVEVQVEDDARIYREVDVLMAQSSLLGDQAIDFLSGNQQSGLAPDGAYFIGRREKNFTEAIAETLETVKPVAEEARLALMQLRNTVDNLQRMTSEGSDFDLALENFRAFGDNLVEISRDGGALHESLENIETITRDLSENERVKRTLQQFQQAAERFQTAASNLNETIGEIGPDLTATTRYARDFTDTLRRQPWRLIWPSTKRYPPDDTRDWRESAGRERGVGFRQEGPPVQREAAPRRPRRVHPTGIRKYHGATRGRVILEPREGYEK